MDYYTLVRHTGYTGTGHIDLRNAVESRGISAKEAEKVRKAGGLVFTDYANATTAEEAANYPPGVEGLVPQAPGTFVSRVLDEQLYIPPGMKLRVTVSKIIEVPHWLPEEAADSDPESWYEYAFTHGDLSLDRGDLESINYDSVTVNVVTEETP